jgi:hypothetical protein
MYNMREANINSTAERAGIEIASTFPIQLLPSRGVGSLERGGNMGV